MGKEKGRGEGEQLNTGGLDEACQQVQVSRCEAPPSKVRPKAGADQPGFLLGSFLDHRMGDLVRV